MVTESTQASFVGRLRPDGDASIWPEFHARYGDLIYAYARARGTRHDIAQDVVQDVELQLFRASGGFQYDPSKGRFRSYLRTAVVRALARRASQDARQPDRVRPEDLAALLEDPQGARSDALWEQEWRHHCLRTAIETVSLEFEPVTWKAFEMHVLAGCPVLESARQLEVSKWRIYRARDRVLARLREVLGGQSGLA